MKTVFQPSARNTEEFPAGRRERKVRWHMETEQTHQERARMNSTSPAAVAYLGTHQDTHCGANNQVFTNEYEVILHMW